MVSMWLFMDLDPIIALKIKEKQMMHLRILIADHVLESLPEYSQYNEAHRRLMLKAEEANIFSCGF